MASNFSVVPVGSSPLTRDRTQALALGAWSLLSHWTREVPGYLNLRWKISVSR